MDGAIPSHTNFMACTGDSFNFKILALSDV